MILVVTVSILVLGCVAFVFGHIRFLRTLSSFQPDVWSLYKRTAYSWRDYPSRYRQLRADVYPKITDARIIRAMRIEQTLLRIFAVSALISVGAFAVWRFRL
jgi:hypothetical protein